MNGNFSEVAFDIAVNSTYTYSIPNHLLDFVKPGVRVIAELRNRKLCGIVVRIIKSTELSKIKELESVLDEKPVLNNEIIEFAYWISDYYFHPIGNILSLFLPDNKYKSDKYYTLEEDSFLKINKIFKDEDTLHNIIRCIEKSKKRMLSYRSIRKVIGFDVKNEIKKLVSAKVLKEFSLVNQKKTDSFIRFIRLSADYLSGKDYVLTKKQKLAVDYLNSVDSVNITDLQKKGFSYSVINLLHKKGVIDVINVEKKFEYENYFKEDNFIPQMNEEQTHCFIKIKESIVENDFKVFLLHGVTGSGKTEVYLNCLSEVLKKGKTGIVLVPEISLTPQVISRFRNRFGDIVGVIHSKLSANEKNYTLNGIINGNIKIIIGARSAIFAPLMNLGIIIVDEEHDSSYKQESSPRYNARDASIMRALYSKAVVILGSATPSIESYYNSENGKYVLLRLTKRVRDLKMPEIQIVDIGRKDNYTSSVKTNNDSDILNSLDKYKFRYLSKKLIIEIGEELNKNNSIILLQNRRGFHSYFECLNCGYIETCINCSLALTFHKKSEILKCHLCGYSKSPVNKCSKCGSLKIIPKGAGTERIEHEILKIFPGVIIKRVDSDTMSSKYIYQKILSDFYKKKINILVGTQMISKGLDFPDVTLVGVINADIGLLLPDFRANERTFQIITQVSGRCGRDRIQGRVLIQTFHPDYLIFKKIVNYDFLGFYKEELEARKIGQFPPFSRIAVIEAKSLNDKYASSVINNIYNNFNKYKTGIIISKPVQPLFSKINNYHRYHIILKSIKSIDQSGKKLLNLIKSVINSVKLPNGVIMKVDIDAVDFL